MKPRKDKPTQYAWVRNTLLTKGTITRNEALRNYITRLSAIIFDLRLYEDMEIEGQYLIRKSGRDYVYRLVK